MKRVLLIATVGLILLLGGAGAAWWFLLGGSEGNGLGQALARIEAAIKQVFEHRQSPAVFLPPDTLCYVEIPNGTQTYLRYQQSQLKQVIDNPETHGLIEASLASLHGTLAKLDPKVAAHLRRAASEGLQAMGGTSFAALTDCNPPAGKEASHAEIAKGIGFIAGFHASPDQGRHVEAFLAELQAAAGDHLKKYPAATGTHGALSYAYWESPGGIRVCRTRWKEWDLITFGEQPLFDFIDRASAPTPGPSLRDTPNYQKLSAQIGPDADAIFYTNFDRFFDLSKQWVALWKTSEKDAVTLDATLKELRFMHAAAGSMAFRKEGIVERGWVLAPEAERGEMSDRFKPIPLKSARFTSASTVLYAAQNFDAESVYDQQKKLSQATQAAPPAPGAPAAPNPYDAIESQLKAQGLDLHENFLHAVGPELAVIIDWPQGQPIPDLLLVWALRDAAKFSPLYDKLTAQMTPMLAMVGTSAPFSSGTFKGISVTPKQFPLISPTLFKGADFWGLSLGVPGAKRLLADGNVPLPLDVLAGPGKAEGAYTLAYARVGEIVGRSYSGVRPALVKYLAANPAYSAWAPCLPAKLTVAPLLGEFRMRDASQGDFLVSEAVSPTSGAVLGLGILAAMVPPICEYSQHARAAAAPAIPLAPTPLASAQKVSMALTLYALHHDGQYPATLDLLLQEPEAAERGVVPALLTDPSGAPRWIYHADRTSSTTEDDVILESAQPVIQDGQTGRIVSRVDKRTLWVALAAPVPTASNAAPTPPSENSAAASGQQ